MGNQRIVQWHVTFGPRNGLFIDFDLTCGHGVGRALTRTEKRDFGHNRLKCTQKRAKCRRCVSEVD